MTNTRSKQETSLCESMKASKIYIRLLLRLPIFAHPLSEMVVVEECNQRLPRNRGQRFLPAPLAGERDTHNQTSVTRFKAGFRTGPPQNLPIWLQNAGKVDIEASPQIQRKTSPSLPWLAKNSA